MCKVFIIFIALLLAMPCVFGTEVTVPRPVQTFLAEWYPDAMKEIRVIKSDDPSFRSEYTLLSFQDVAAPTKDTRGWIIGVRLGTLGEGLYEIDRFHFVDHFGNLIFSIDNPTSVISCSIVEIKKDFWCLVFSYAGGRPDYCGGVEVIPLAKDARSIFEYVCPSGKNWESKLYFFDADDDGTKDILIERRVWTTGNKTSKLEREMYTFDGILWMLRENEPIKLHIDNAKRDPRTKNAMQFGRPREN